MPLCRRHDSSSVVEIGRRSRSGWSQWWRWRSQHRRRRRRRQQRRRHLWRLHRRKEQVIGQQRQRQPGGHSDGRCSGSLPRTGWCQRRCRRRHGSRRCGRSTCCHRSAALAAAGAAGTATATATRKRGGHVPQRVREACGERRTQRTVLSPLQQRAAILARKPRRVDDGSGCSSRIATAACRGCHQSVDYRHRDDIQHTRAGIERRQRCAGRSRRRHC